MSVGFGFAKLNQTMIQAVNNTSLVECAYTYHCHS